MEATWNVLYSLRHAYVYSILTIDGKAPYLSFSLLRQTNTSWRSNAIYKFIFDGKVVSIARDGITVKCDALDEEFLNLAQALDPTEHKIWRQVYEQLMRGKDRGEVLEFLRVNAIARKLK